MRVRRGLGAGSISLMGAIIAVFAWAGCAGEEEPAGGGCTIDQATATTSVSMVENAFDPQCIKINAGDTVTWANNGSADHTITSDPGASASFDSGAVAPGATFEFTFPSDATVYYHCTPHEGAGMVGTVFVGTGGADAQKPSGGGGGGYY